MSTLLIDDLKRDRVDARVLDYRPGNANERVKNAQLRVTKGRPRERRLKREVLLCKVLQLLRGLTEIPFHRVRDLAPFPASGLQPRYGNLRMHN